MFGIGLPELLVVAVVALLVLGPARLPELARSLGKGLAEFRRASADLRSSIMDATKDAREPLEEMQRELREATRLPTPAAQPPDAAKASVDGKPGAGVDDEPATEAKAEAEPDLEADAKVDTKLDQASAIAEAKTAEPPGPSVASQAGKPPEGG